MDYEYTGDDGEMSNGTLHYKVVNGKVDPNSLRGESEYNGDHKVDDELATDMVKPGGSDHEDALKAAQEDYDFESDRMRSKFGAEDKDKFLRQINSQQAWGDHLAANPTFTLQEDYGNYSAINPMTGIPYLYSMSNVDAATQ